jgi:hypothetical protein
MGLTLPQKKIGLENDSGTVSLQASDLEWSPWSLDAPVAFLKN